MRILMIAAAVGLASAGAWAMEPPGGFLGSYDKALEQARKENKPLYLHFTTDWCGWCRKIEQEDYADPKGQAALKDFVPASLDCSDGAADSAKNQALEDKYGAHGIYPYMVVLAPDGAMLYSIRGYKPLDDFLAAMKEAKGNFRKYDEFAEYAKKADPKSYEYNRKAMDVYEMAHQWDKASAAAQQVLKLDPKNDKGDAASAKLILLEAARTGKDPKKVASLQEDIRKLDPANEKGAFEKMVRSQVDLDLQHMDPDNRQETLKKVEASLSELGQMKNLKAPGEILYLLGFVQAAQGKLDVALTTEEKALAADPNGPKAETIKMAIQEIKRRRPNASSKPAG